MVRRQHRQVDQDPLGFDAGDSNLYRYVYNRPTSAVDPSGLKPEGPVLAYTLKFGGLAPAFEGVNSDKSLRRWFRNDEDWTNSAVYYLAKLHKVQTDDYKKNVKAIQKSLKEKDDFQEKNDLNGPLVWFHPHGALQDGKTIKVTNL
jgi:hypothetical protein